MRANEEYVIEILQQLPDGLTRVGFYDLCKRDTDAGYRVEVDEAWRRYCDQNLAARRRVSARKTG